MAKFSKTVNYEINLYDHVWFCVDRPSGFYIEGTVQSLVNFPDSIWVETGVPGLKWSGDMHDLIGYRRWEITLDQIDFDHPLTKAVMKSNEQLAIDNDEGLEFIYAEDLKTKIVSNKYCQ